jgi:hypothetical protein
MYETILKTGTVTLLIAIPAIGMLLISFLRLDQFLASPKRRIEGPRFVRGVDESGDPIMCDPDGKPWEENGSNSARRRLEYREFHVLEPLHPGEKQPKEDARISN